MRLTRTGNLAKYIDFTGSSFFILYYVSEHHNCPPSIPSWPIFRKGAPSTSAIGWRQIRIGGHQAGSSSTRPSSGSDPASGRRGGGIVWDPQISPENWSKELEPHQPAIEVGRSSGLAAVSHRHGRRFGPVVVSARGTTTTVN